MKPEERISKDVQTLLRDTVGCYVASLEQGYRKERGGTRITPGIPDLWVCHPPTGIWTWAELKTPKGRLTTHQEGFRLMCE